MAKKIGKEPRVTPNGEIDLSPERAFVVKRTGKQIAKLQQRIKVTKWVLLALLCLVILLYLLFILLGGAGGKGGDKGDFTVTIDKNLRNLITMSEFGDFEETAFVLEGTSQHDMWHCTRDWIPADIQDQSEGGAHSSVDPSYLAYTFHTKNVSENTVYYTYDLDLVEEYVPGDLRALDAIRIMIIKDGEKVVWADAPYDGEEAVNTFLGEEELIKVEGVEIKPGDIDKYTVVMWFEGHDQQCINDIFYSKIKFKMDFCVDNPIKEKSDK
ncbi:MAG: hypothetical protein IKU52_04905 [Clostridia bacterium]|nr:hypothetical protein [Clostridia bacterium]